ncbi:MAG: hypothetical protein AAGM22_20925 [Acidobacteriota bacterium]
MDGSVRTWSGTLPANLEGGGSLLLDLTMTTLADQDLVIGYEVVVGEPAEVIFADGFEDGTADAWSAVVP